MNTLGTNNVVFKNDTHTPTPAPTTAPTPAPATSIWDKPEMEEILEGVGGVVVAAAVGAVIYYTCYKCKTVTTEDRDGLQERFIHGSATREELEKAMAEQGISKMDRNAIRWANRVLTRKERNLYSSDTQFFELKDQSGQVRAIIDDDFYNQISLESKDIVHQWMEAKRSYHETIMDLESTEAAKPGMVLDEIRLGIQAYTRLEDKMNAAKAEYDAVRGLPAKRWSSYLANKGNEDEDNDEEIQAEMKKLREQEYNADMKYQKAETDFKQSVKINPNKLKTYQSKEIALQESERLMVDMITDDPGAKVARPMSIEEMEAVDGITDAAANTLINTSGAIMSVRGKPTLRQQKKASSIWKAGLERTEEEKAMRKAKIKRAPVTFNKKTEIHTIERRGQPRINLRPMTREITGIPSTGGINDDSAAANFTTQTESGALNRLSGEEGARPLRSILKRITTEVEEDPEAFIK